MKQFSQISLVAKLRLIIVTVTGILLLLSSTISITYLTYDSFRSSENFFNSHTEIVSSNLSAALAFQDEIGTQTVLDTMADDVHITAAMVTDIEFRTLAELGDSGIIAPRVNSNRSIAAFEQFSDLRSIWLVKTITQGDEILGYLFVVADHDEVIENFLNQVFVTVVILLMMMVLVVPIAQALARSISSPIKSLAETMLVVSTEDDFSIRAKKTSTDEIGYLVDQFNTMLQQIEERDQRLHEYSYELEAFIEKLEKTKEAAIQASEVKSQFLANMSHEIRTPMNGVVGMLDLLKDCTISSEQRDYVEVASKSATGLLSIINDILDLSKIEAGKMSLNLESAAPGDVVEEVINILHQVALRKDIQLIGIIEPAAYELAQIDPTRLRQVLLNLIGNSVKFTHEGYVSVSCSVVTTQNQSQLHISVIDTGIGISKENHHKLFEAFDQADGSTTRQYGGTGLGLTICRQVVSLMGGNIAVDSEIGKGSTFSFSVPVELSDVANEPISNAALAKTRTAIHIENTLLAESVNKLAQALNLDTVDLSESNTKTIDIVITDNPQFQCDSARVLCIVEKHSKKSTAEESQELVLPIRLRALKNSLLQNQSEKPKVLQQPKYDMQNAKVLLVEDNMVNQMVAAKMLEKFGIACDKAADGLEAVRMTSESKYDLILMDCQMPNMDGFEATAKIRQQQQISKQASTPIVALTANAMEEDERRCLEAGMDDYLAKPIESERMGKTLDRWLSVPANVS